MLVQGGAFGLVFLMAAAVAGAQPLPAVNPGHVPDSLVDAAIPAPARSGVPVVLGARVGEQADRTRFVIELSDPLELRVFTLTNPDRVVVDMPKSSGASRAPTGRWVQAPCEPIATGSSGPEIRASSST